MTSSAIQNNSAQSVGPTAGSVAPAEDTPLLHSEVGSPSGDNEESPISRSPYIGGVSVTQFRAVYTIICLTYGISCFDMTIMASIHPVITSYFRSANAASWLSTAFILTATSCQPMMGRLSDVTGRKIPFLCALLLFSVSTVWCAVAQSMIGFILARAACGAGAGVMVSLGAIMTSDMVPLEIRGIYQSYINIIYGVASVMGAATGGAMADALGWRWTFGVQVPILLACLVVAILVIPKDIGKSAPTQPGSALDSLKQFDWVGSILLTLALVLLILALTLGGNIYPWTHPFVYASLGGSALLFPVFLLHEKRHPRPIIPLDLVLHPPHLNLFVANFLLTAIANAILFNAPLFFRAVLFESPTTTGFRLTIIFSMSSLTGALTGFLVTWTRRLKWPLMTGSTMLLFGTACVTQGLQRRFPSSVYSLALLPSSLAQGFCFPGSVMAVLGVSTQQQQAVVVSILILFRNVGMIIGVAYSSLLFQNSLFYFLNEFVTGPDKDQIILRVRESVDSIARLKQPYQEQVVEAYSQSLKLTFMSTIILGCVMVCILLPLRLPRLEHKKV
ncbi:MFS general substrate transporter [Thozetella sp. PMI_491]|nr:MFS general substrate transporter [Thozetella sp. PMI_491]